MMRLITVVIALTVAGTAHAECPTANVGNGTVHPLNPVNKTDVDLILSMSMMPKMMKVDYAKERGKKLDCELTAFDASGTHYTLWATDTTKGTSRVALPLDKGGAIAELLPVTNLMEAIEASKQGKTAPVRGYMLMTLTKADLTGWRLYDDVPNQQTLVADMSAALSGHLHPIFKNDTNGKSAIFVPGA